MDRAVAARHIGAMQDKDRDLSYYFATPPRDALDRELQEEVASVSELFSNGNERAVLVLVAVAEKGCNARVCVVRSKFPPAAEEDFVASLVEAISDQFRAP